MGLGMRTHGHIEMLNESGEHVKALAPVIVSASRATDIPAFFSPWFFDRLDKGYCVWRNPYNGMDSYVSFANTRFIVFWSKNPAPLLLYLPNLKERGIGFYIQYTLNDYQQERLEPNVQRLTDRTDTFKRIVDAYGPGSAVWRLDPLILTDKIGIDELLEKIRHIAYELDGYTDRLVFSFADIAGYRKVSANLQRAGVNYREWTEKDMLELADGLQRLNLPVRLATCAESIDLSPYGISHNRCIDPDLISRLAPDDPTLQMWLFGATKDSGQRQGCGCILSKDIGRYNTCTHGCLYCYATNTPAPVGNRTQHPFHPHIQITSLTK
ncbi:MAG: DUF1848 domain-containing protein [Pseudoflavonifractor sp.]|nr:DUF1848 domain-containing protein [Pseudoflavonifractor sp.]